MDDKYADKTIDGVTYYFDKSGLMADNNTCVGCAADMNTPDGLRLHRQFPDCKGGVWKKK